MGLEANIFSNLLRNVQKIDRVELFTSYPIRQVNDDVSESEYVLKAFRKLMQQTHDDESKIGMFFDFASYGSQLDSVVAKDYRTGLIAAVDGTDQLPPTTLAATTIYAVEVFGKTSQSKSACLCSVCETRISSPNGIGTPDIYELARYLDGSRGGESSSFTTFREYQERLFACEELPRSVLVCMIDGPLFTQNLLTQEHGRELLEKMIKGNRKYIGIIKNLSGSWALCRWAAHCLQSGEGYVIGSLSEQFTEDRARSAGGASGAVRDWLSQDKRGGFVRVVYRPHEASFAFECHIDDLEYAVALLRFDASKQINHEMPRLMQLTDAEARRANTSSKAKEKLVCEVMKKNRRLGNDIDDERRSR